MPQTTHLTDEVAEVICSQVAIGRSMALAAAAAGFDRTTAVKWQAMGNADLRAGVASVHARFVVRLARARGELSDMLTRRALEGLDQPPSLSNTRDTLSVLKTFLPSFYGERAADLDAAAELAATQPETDAGASPSDQAVAVELVRCPSCGTGTAADEGTPRFCAACGQRLPTDGAKSG